MVKKKEQTEKKTAKKTEKKDAIKIVRKLSVKAVCGNVKAILKDYEITEGLDIMSVIGGARSVKAIDTPYGTSHCLMGEFECVNMLTGEISRGTKIFLPDVASEIIENALADDDSEFVKFGFSIGLAESDSTVGYEYTATPLIKPKETNLLAEIKAEIKALPEGS